ncbi:50S ribosomal protein L24 [Candidatus Berkelbacteria bacterium RIFCSPLOWO2_01_FULL_50_28]|uniref:Large ribosomal subunit protein uL24 n=1 Tax=Candidatus Berkelbacteria bacterium RIFCSPLOWO2_01_FULL_50_28 TaxID=1797471 RepID=A0A1F5ECA7_9BACT|nr:MAG: 50S ribosomal protein L24 [Candidatus Berkelbacteria bacterium RIFCSPHIGHO2_01_FULL_50_36]OGD62263.1 MAG: 50S ribosomal protein L24 [Candidatus Berkelbacteria bacterium RIFCSPHIGHO2_12_FULL_50_11]OGD64906.1 MAG: 50S ribosomal protein L24 [Candidatus Berkelbacteria bacterium RIFCSPLOWO2_01_FULL_50_28]
MRVLKGDKVLVIAGKDRGKTGVVERVLPKKNRLVIAGINVVKKHLKRSAKNPQGGIIDKSLPLHASNVMLLDPSRAKPTRVGWRFEGKKKIRFSKLSNEPIEIKKND